MKKFNKSLHTMVQEVSYDVLDRVLAAAKNTDMSLEEHVQRMKEELKATQVEADKPQKNGKKEKNPDAPKGAMTSYIYFSNAMRSKVKQEDPELKLTEVSKKIGEMWKGLTEEGKKPYIDMAAKDKVRYEKEKATHNA